MVDANGAATYTSEDGTVTNIPAPPAYLSDMADVLAAPAHDLNSSREYKLVREVGGTHWVVRQVVPEQDVTYRETGSGNHNVAGHHMVHGSTIHCTGGTYGFHAVAHDKSGEIFIASTGGMGFSATGWDVVHHFSFANGIQTDPVAMSILGTNVVTRVSTLITDTVKELMITQIN